jgi:hypothetical protein
MNLFEASKQWANRPPDERRSDLKDLYVTCLDYFRRSSESEGVDLRNLKVSETQSGDLEVFDDKGNAAGFTNWAFRQFCSRVGAPAAYLAKLPAKWTADLLNYGLQKPPENGDGKANLLVQSLDDNRKVIMAATSGIYSRFWNWEIADRLLRLTLQDEGWRVPPARPCKADQPGARPATEEDILQGPGFGSVSVGDMIAPAGIYSSDHDLFVFLVNESARIADGTDEGLSRGFFVENSEVGAKKFRMLRFLYRHVCGNHIVWGATKVAEIAIRHVGNVQDKVTEALEAKLTEYSEESASDDEAKIARAMQLTLGKDRDEVLDKLFGLGVAPKKALAAAYTSTEQLFPVDGDPRTAWGMVQGMTRVSQEAAFGEDRMALDRAAGKVIELAN